MVEQDLTYSIIFDIPKDPISVDEFAKGMQETLSSLEEMNNAIACGINTSIKVISYIESIEAGSIEFKLKDDAKLEKDEKALEVLSASLITVATGDLSAFIPLLLKKCRGTIIQIQNRAIENKEKKKLIEEAITKELKDSGINNELIGYYLDKDRLNKAIKHFSGGVKKTGDNVFYKPSAKEDKIKINSSLADFVENQDKIIEEEEVKESPQYINGHITIYSPVFDATKTKWRFKYNNNTETIDISKTNIANFILRRGKVVVGDCFKVKLEIIEKKTKNGYKNDYSVVEVLGFIEGNEQKEFRYSFKKEEDEENS